MSGSDTTSVGGESTPPSSAPSPELFKLTLAELTDEKKEKAASIKLEANKAFGGTFSLPPWRISPPGVSCPDWRFKN
jgi:hypothetical protein